MANKFVVTVGNQVVYTGRDGVMVAAVVARAVTLTTENLKEVGEYIHKEWVREAQTSSKFATPSQSHRERRGVDYRADYIKGIERPVVAGGALDIQMRDMTALKVEMGWAPPQSGVDRDGIGMWDGEKHDLRPWLFSFGTIRTVNGKRYRNLRFVGPNKKAQIDALVNEAMSQFDADRNSGHRESYERDQRAQAEEGYRAAIVMSNRNPGTWTMSGAQLAHAPTAAHNHVSWLYNKARPMRGDDVTDKNYFKYRTRDTAIIHVNARGTKFKTFRTVFEDAKEQSFPDSFHSAGIKPVGLITGANAPVAKKLRDAIKNVLAGKRPDGGTRGNRP
jgi:hypothetical protein